LKLVLKTNNNTVDDTRTTLTRTLYKLPSATSTNETTSLDERISKNQWITSQISNEPPELTTDDIFILHKLSKAINRLLQKEIDTNSK
jgi:hypothetical protein